MLSPAIRKGKIIDSWFTAAGPKNTGDHPVSAAPPIAAQVRPLCSAAAAIETRRLTKNQEVS